MLNLSYYQMQSLVQTLLSQKIETLIPVLKRRLLSQRVVLSDEMCRVALYNVIKRASSTG